ncbi:MAG: hypothetical protein ACYC2J_13060, partial [Acidithiobacillus ferrooxidans]
MPDLRRSILIAVSMVALAPTGAPAAMADNASGALDVRMKAELSRLQSEQHHLEGQLAMAHEIAKLQFNINQMRQELLQSLQHSNGYSRHLSSRTPNPSLSRTTEPVPPVYAQVQPQPEAMANRTTNEPLPPINAEAPRSSSG